jgi:DNA-binding transcriptional MerR regulator
MARSAGVSADTLRHYERKGLLAAPRRSANGYREYPEETLDRVRLIRGALSVGFTLDELAEVLAVRDRGGAPCRRVRALAAEKLEELERRMRELAALGDELRTALGAWDRRLAETPRGEPARLLDALAGAAPRGERARLPEKRPRRTHV